MGKVKHARRRNKAANARAAGNAGTVQSPISFMLSTKKIVIKLSKKDAKEIRKAFYYLCSNSCDQPDSFEPILTKLLDQIIVQDAKH